MLKTILVIISKAAQLDLINLAEVPSQLQAKFILIINENLKAKITAVHLQRYAQIIYVKVNTVSDMEIYHLEPELMNAVSLVCESYSDIYAFTTDEANLELIEKVLASHNIPGWGKQTALLCRNKVLMKQYMQKHGIRTPKFMAFSADMEFDDLEREFKLPFVLKPVDSLGSLGVVFINNSEEYVNFLAGHDIGQVYQAEEFIGGTLYHIDTVRYDKHSFVTIGEYTYPMAEYADGKIQGSIEVLPGDKHYSLLLEFNKRVVDSIQNNGCYHHEVFINSSGELIFLEIAWRQAGKPVNDIFTQHFGISQTVLYIMLHIDPTANWKMGYSGEYSIRFFIPKQIGVYAGLKLPKLHAAAVVTDLIPINTKIDTAATFYSDAMAMLTLTYPSFKEHYAHIIEDFFVLKTAVLI